MSYSSALLKLDVLIEIMERHYNSEVNLPDPNRNQCHICTRFQTVDNPLFAYAIRENGDFIYRCRKGHDHDLGMCYMDIHTGMEVYC